MARAKEEAAAVGGTASIGSYLTNLIERDAEAKGIQFGAEPVDGSKQAAPKAKAKRRT